MNSGLADRKDRERPCGHHIASLVDRDRLRKIGTTTGAFDRLSPQLRPGGSVQFDHGKVAAGSACRDHIPCAIDRRRVESAAARTGKTGLPGPGLGAHEDEADNQNQGKE